MAPHDRDVHVEDVDVPGNGPVIGTTSGHANTATMLVDLVRAEGAELWHTPDAEAYISLRHGSHREHWPVRDRGCRVWLSRLLWQSEHRAASRQALQDAIAVLEGMAIHDGPEHPVYVRTAWYEGRIYLDIGNDSWQAIEIAATGWRVVDEPPVRFRRPKATAPLPLPETGGDVSDLRELLGWADDDTWTTVVSWLLMAYRPSGPYPVLLLRGQQGSGKSTVARALRALVDPSTVPLRTVPRTEQDLLVAARNGWIVTADNLSGCPVWFSDALCRLATGGGWSARQLYTDAEEALIDACRPVLLTGIGLAPERQDLLDRAVIADLPTITRRYTEDAWWAAFERIRPRVLGAVLDAVSQALRRPAEVPDPLRMADYAAWIAAAEPALGWSEHRAIHAYRNQRQDAVRTALEGSPLVAVLLRWMQGRTEWEGTPTELYEKLSHIATQSERQARSWPGSAAAMTTQIERLAPGLAEAERIVATRSRNGHDRRRTWRLRRE